MIVDDGRTGRDWLSLGAAAVLPGELTRELLLDSLASHAHLVGNASLLAAAVDELEIFVPWRGNVAAVCGPGGTGASTVASSLAQGLGRHASNRATVLLADLALHAEQAMLHDVRDVVPGVQELIEAHRVRRPSPAEVQALTFSVVDRHYHLLLGLRRAKYWTGLKAKAFDAAFDSLRRSFGTVVCDVSADVEREDDTGSLDVEDRNLMARTATAAADVLFVVGRPGVKGLHSLLRVMGEMVGSGVEPARIVPALNCVSLRPRARAEMAKALTELAQPFLGNATTAPPIFLPRRKVESAWRDGVRMPAPLPATLAGAFLAVLERVGPVVASAALEPALVVPGSLGHWTGASGEAAV